MEMFHCRNVPWMLLYKVIVFLADLKSKITATEEHNLTLHLMGNIFKGLLLRNHRSQWKYLIAEMFLGWSSTKLLFFGRSEIQDGRHGRL